MFGGEGGSYIALSHQKQKRVYGVHRYIDLEYPLQVLRLRLMTWCRCSGVFCLRKKRQVKPAKKRTAPAGHLDRKQGVQLQPKKISWTA
jgi:hypothetical protein